MCPEPNSIEISACRASVVLCLMAYYLKHGYTVRNIKVARFWFVKRYCVTMVREQSAQPFLDFTIGPVGEKPHVDSN